MAYVEPVGEDDAKKKTEWEKTHRQAMEEYARDFEHQRVNIDEAYEDLRFRRGRLQDQWAPEALAVRKGRPCHVVNKLPQFIRQVTGDMRQSRPGIKVVPTDSKGTVDTAEVLAGMVRYVENRSAAKHIYTTGADSQVTCGIGHWQVTTERAHAATFNQEIRVTGIEDGVAVVWDADSVLPTREDAQRCFVPVDMSTEMFKQRWPDAQWSGFDLSVAGLAHQGAFTNWTGDNFIRVAAYWKKVPMERTLALFKDGSIDDLTDVLGESTPEQNAEGIKFLQEQQGARIEKVESYKICRYLITMAEVLEEADWPGMHIPIIPAIGEEVRIGRGVYRHGIVRYARDLQRMVNYYSSAETEVIALQPKAPWIGTKKMFQDHYDLWDTANTENHPFLEFTADPAIPGGKPERVAPPVASVAIQQGALNAANDMKAVIGIYDASLGAKSNETSGIAIERRDQQGDTGTYVYHDNFALAIQRTGQIIIDLIPHIYDTQRQLRILGEDGKPDLVTINQPKMIDGVKKVENDVTVGAYDVIVEEGPNYSTKREQAKDAITQFIQAFPPAAPLIGDIYAKIMDFPYSQEIGERLEEALPPPIKAKLQAEREQAEQASGKPPAPPTPQEQQMAAAQQKQQQLQDQEIALKMDEQKAKTEKALADARKANAEADKAEAEAKKIQIESAQSHMEELRRIEAHGRTMDEGEVTHARTHAHEMDRHHVDMARQGLEEYRAGVAEERNAEKHDETVKQMKQPKQPAEAE